jgi:hypothetical protein
MESRQKNNGTIRRVPSAMRTTPGATHTLTVIADTSDRFSDFAPYVPSINNRGDIAFQAALRHGGTAVFIADGAGDRPAAQLASDRIREVCSHPDINDAGDCSFYATRDDGRGVVGISRRGELEYLTVSPGPLGPTMNNSGAVAFRTDASSASGGVFVAQSGLVMQVATLGDRFTAFHGLPVIASDDRVIFRADTRSGAGIYMFSAGNTSPVVEVGDVFKSLGNFPTADDRGRVIFAADRHAGGPGVFVATNGHIETVVDSSRGFESFRGALLSNSGRIVYFATPSGGSLGIFTGPDPVRDRLFSLGAPLLGSTLTDFALNPVSINDSGQLAIRVRLTSGRQCILRADPEPSAPRHT